MLKLKKAEEEATKQVEAARKERTATLRAARQEADAEIKSYRDAQMEKLTQLQQNKSTDEDVLDKLKTQTAADVETLKVDVAKGRASVVERLIGVVTTVDTSVPEARKGVKSK